MPKLARTLFVIVVLSLNLSACSLFGTKPTEPTATSAPATAAPVPTAYTPIAVSDPSKLVGTWKGVYNTSDVAMTFDAQGNVSIAAYGNIQTGTFTLDLTAVPYHLDMEIKDVGTLATIIEFVNENTVRIENVFPFAERPSTFNDFFLLTFVSK